MLKEATIISKPWGHEELWAHTSRYVGKILVIKGGHRLSRQYHKVKQETIMILEGTLTLEAGPYFEGILFTPTKWNQAPSFKSTPAPSIGFVPKKETFD